MHLESYSARPTPIPVPRPGGSPITVGRVPDGCLVELHTLHQRFEEGSRVQGLVETTTVLYPKNGFVSNSAVDCVRGRIASAIGPDYSPFGAHLAVLDPRDHLADGSSIVLHERNLDGGRWCTGQLPGHPRDMRDGGWSYLAHIAVDSLSRKPNGPRRERSILLPLEHLDLNVFSIRDMLLKAGLLSLDPGEVIGKVHLKVQREEGSQITSWGTTNIRRLDLDGLPPVWIKTTELASPDSAAALEILGSRSNSTFGAHGSDMDEAGEGVLVPDDHGDAAML